MPGVIGVAELGRMATSGVTVAISVIACGRAEDNFSGTVTLVERGLCREE